MRDDRRLLENRLKSKRTLPAETQATYYGAWYYAAIHILVTIPEFRTRAAIAERLGLPAERVASVLEFLEHAGLIARAEDGTYRGSEENVYLGNDSANLDKHHTHWRLRAIHALDHRGVKDALEMHYSSVVSMSRADAPLARKILLEAVEKILAVVRPSKEEELFCYTLDFFEV
jgi:predicted transcriptional regulator